MLSALVLLRHASASTAAARLGPPEAGRARAMADFLQLYSPAVLRSAPGRACTATLAPLAARLELAVETSEGLTADDPKFPGGGGPAHTAAWLASRASAALPDDPRRTAVVCAEGPVLGALLVAVAARDAHDLSAYDLALPLDGAADLPPGSGWVLHRDDGRLMDVKPLAPR